MSVILAKPVQSFKRLRGCPRVLLLLPAAVLLLAGCEPETNTAPPKPRPVRTVVAEKSELGSSVVLTGQLQAENEAALSFRIGGRIIERLAGAGDPVEPGQILARLDPQDELNALRSARAALSAAKGKLAERATPSNARRRFLPGG